VEIHHHRRLTTRIRYPALRGHRNRKVYMACHRTMLRRGLYDYLIEKGRLSEDETRIIFGQLCLAVGYTHRQRRRPS